MDNGFKYEEQAPVCTEDRPFKSRYRSLIGTWDSCYTRLRIAAALSLSPASDLGRTAIRTLRRTAFAKPPAAQWASLRKRSQATRMFRPTTSSP